MKLLCFDTTAKTASAAVVTEGKILAESSVTTGLTHSQTLMPLTDGMLKAAGLTLGDIDLVAVSHGPGSFTGLRIGIGTVKGLCQGSGKKCIGISTLEALAYAYEGQDVLICPVMDARCKQVYTALFQGRNNLTGGVGRLWNDIALSIEELGRNLKETRVPIMLVGDGAELVYQALAGQNPSLRLAAPGMRLQRAANVGFAALEHLKTEEPISPDLLMPQYLRLPQAERELLAKQQAQKNG